MGKLIGFLIFLSGLVVAAAAAATAYWNILKTRKTDSVELGDELKKYCESWRINVEVNSIRGLDVAPQECVGSCCTLEGDGKDAWIFYVDDTLFSTISYFKKHGFGREKLNGTCLEAWLREGKAPALEHTLKLFHEIKDSGIKIFLISSRREKLIIIISLGLDTMDGLVSH
ncbi:hypothetical protein C1H46_004575 [Malus baccata]|uniref:Acid phosphatase n=1 Tax=Malus baccata TaxID=106549 RepID=A0A540NFJ4_MALBA|nr:hypothetical protein C1H46_004575 [Malus baccata]